jgi:hypothetical protein
MREPKTFIPPYNSTKINSHIYIITQITEKTNKFSDEYCDGKITTQLYEGGVPIQTRIAIKYHDT